MPVLFSYSMVVAGLIGSLVLGSLGLSNLQEKPYHIEDVVDTGDNEKEITIDINNGDKMAIVTRNNKLVAAVIFKKNGKIGAQFNENKYTNLPWKDFWNDLNDKERSIIMDLSK